MTNYLIIIAFTLMLYFPALKCLIIVDDVRWYGNIKQGHWAWTQNPTLKNIIPWLTARLYSGGTFGIKWNQKITRWSITSVQIDHAFSIALTALIGVLMYLDFHSLWAVLLWTSASSTTHIAVWLNGRRYAVSIILVLLMVACLNAGGWWVALAIPLYALTPLFHMTAFCAPVMYWPFIPVMGVIVVTFWPKLYQHWQTKEDAIVLCSRKDYNVKRLIPIIKSYGFYFFKMMFPMMTRTNYDCLYMWGVTPEGNKDAYEFNINFYKGIAAFLITIIAYMAMPYNHRCWVLFTFLGTLQWCNIVNTTQIVSDRYIILPNVFCQVILALWLPWWACASIVVANVCFTSMAFRMYENIQGMFDYHMYHWPQYTTPNKEYVALCVKQGNYIKAYTLVKECLRFNPTDWDLLLAAAVCARVANERKAARAYVDIMQEHLYYGLEDKQKLWMQNFLASM
jgi:hypothetical protein